MTEIAKCRCGAEARITADFAVARDPDVPESAFGPRHLIPVPDGHYEIECPGDCGVYVWAPTLEKAAGRWNALMRPLPVARWGAPAVVTYLYVGRAVLGYVLTCHSGGESAVFGITGEHFRGYDARAWLVARVRAAGFEVREEVSDE